MAHLAWLMGAASTAQALVREVTNVKQAWNGGDDCKTVALIKVATAHMISIWFGEIEDQAGLAEDAVRTRRENAASSMLEVINGYLASFEPGARTRTVRDLKTFTEMDLQWTWENDQGTERLTYAGLLLARALEASGQDCIEWNKVCFPVESPMQLKEAGAVLQDYPLRERSVLSSVLKSSQEGTACMKRFHNINKLEELRSI